MKPNRLLIRLLTFTYLVLVSAQISPLIRNVITQTPKHIDIILWVGFIYSHHVIKTNFTKKKKS